MRKILINLTSGEHVWYIHNNYNYTHVGNKLEKNTVIMILDKLFKSLEHNCVGFEKYLNGQQIEKGYKPDYVLKKQNQYVILESENSSSRKMYVGGMLKAEHYLQHEREGILVFVIKPKSNTKVSCIAGHLKPYFEWIKGRTNLKEVYVIATEKYYSEDKVLSIGCPNFIKQSIKV